MVDFNDAENMEQRAKDSGMEDKAKKQIQNRFNDGQGDQGQQQGDSQQQGQSQ
jgi:hypothetical protein